MLAQQKERWNIVGLTVSQWRPMTSEPEHAVGIVGVVWDSQTKTKFVSKSWRSPKKKSSIVITLRFLTFRPKSIVFSKKSFHLKISVSFHFKIIVFSKKKGLYLGSASVSLILSLNHGVLY